MIYVRYQDEVANDGRKFVTSTHAHVCVFYGVCDSNMLAENLALNK